MTDPEKSRPDEDEPSLDMLTQAFAEAMGKANDLSSKPPAEAELHHDRADSNSTAEAHSGDVCPISPQSVLESILFVGHPQDEPITSRSVAGLLRGVEPTEVDDLVSALNQEYASHAIPLRIESRGAGYQLRLDQDFGYLQNRFYGRVREAKLSPTAIEVLAVVAYNQPVSRKQVDNLVGIDSGRTLRQLLRRQLIARQSVNKSTKKEYVTTTRFLELFGLTDLEDLPRSDDPQ